MQNTKHIERGRNGEVLAAKYLQQAGFSIKHCNWRYKQYEIDIIAEKNNIIHFIEVKTRHTTTFGFPEESVNRKKFKKIQKAASVFLTRYDYEMKIQFDIVAITHLAGKEIEYFFIEDIYIY